MDSKYKNKSNILKMIDIMILTNADLTPMQDSTKSLCGSKEGSDQIWDEFFGLHEQTDVPDLYEYLCYGINKSMNNNYFYEDHN